LPVRTDVSNDVILKSKRVTKLVNLLIIEPEKSNKFVQVTQPHRTKVTKKFGSATAFS